RVRVIHAHQYTPFFYSAASGIFRKRPALLFTEHGRWHPDRPNRKRMIFNRLMLRARDRVVGVGEHVRKALIVNEGISPDRVGVIYNGVDLHAYGKTVAFDDMRNHVRSDLGIAKDAVVVVQVARLDPLKDHVTAIQTAAEVIKRRSNMQFL